MFVCFNVFYRHSVISFIIYGQFWGHQLAALWLGVNFISMVLKHKQTKIINPLVAEHRHHSVEYKFYCNRSRQVPRTLHNIIIGNKTSLRGPKHGRHFHSGCKGGAVLVGVPRQRDNSEDAHSGDIRKPQRCSRESVLAL